MIGEGEVETDRVEFAAKVQVKHSRSIGRSISPLEEFRKLSGHSVGKALLVLATETGAGQNGWRPKEGDLTLSWLQTNC